MKFILNEYWSSSMPQWFKKAIDNDANSNAQIKGYANKRRPKRLWKTPLTQNKDKYISRTAEWGSPQFEYSSSKTNKQGEKPIVYSLTGGFDALGIDLSKAKFMTDGDIPSKPSDKRLEDPYIPIFLFTHDGKNVVYAKGVNDYLRCPWDDNNRTFGRMPLKNLLQRVEDFYYIDKSDINNLYTEEQNKQERKDRYSRALNTERIVPDTTLNPQKVMFHDRDKSGNKSADPYKYSAKLYDMTKYDFSSLLKNSFDALKELRDNVSKINPISTDFSKLNSSVDYKELVKDYTNKLKSYLSNRPNATDSIKSTSGWAKELKSIIKEINSVNSTLVDATNNFNTDSTDDYEIINP